MSLQRGQLLAEARTEFNGRGSLGGQRGGIILPWRVGKEFVGALGKAQLRVALLLHVHAVNKACELGQRLQGQHDVLVHLEGIGATGDCAQLLAVLPVELGLRRIGRHEDLSVGIALKQGAHALHATAGQLRTVAGDVNQQRGLGSLGPGGLHLVINGADVLVVEMFQRQQCLFAIGGEGKCPRKLQDDAAGFVKVRTEELQAERARHRILGIQHEDRRGDDAVGAFLLQAGNP